MPPKPKFSRDEIVQAALALVSEKGAEALTARELGMRLGSSARPIFTVFKGMEELQGEVRDAARPHVGSGGRAGAPELPARRRAGLQMALFGMREPKLYQLLFMQENRDAAGFDDVFGVLGVTAEFCIEAICRDYGLNREQARLLFENVWIYTFGVGAMCATRMCRFSEEELGRMLSTAFRAMMLLIQSGGTDV